MTIKRLFPLSLLIGALSISACGDSLPDFENNKNSNKDSEVKDSSENSESEAPQDSNTSEEDNLEEQEQGDKDDEKEEVSIISMSFEQSSYTLALDESIKPKLNYVSNASEELSFKWISDNTSICSATAEGRVYGLKVGICNITAYYDSNKNNILDSSEKSATAQFRVYNPTMTIYLDSNDYTLAVNNSVHASPSYDGGFDLNPKFSWKSNNTNVVTVTNGEIIGKAVGTTTIICYYDENKNSNFDLGIDPYTSASVTVVSSIDISATNNIKYYPGKKKNKDATLPDEKYYSTDINVHNINTEGKVPYIDFNTYHLILLYQTNFIAHVTNTEDFCKFTKESDGRYKLVFITDDTTINDEIRNSTTYFDISNNTITCDNITMFSTILQSWNNGVPNDMCSPYGIVKTSTKTKYIDSPTPTTFDLNRYNLHMYEIDSVPYIPLHVALSLAGGYDSYYYDGKNLVETKKLENIETTFFYSNKDNFIFDVKVSSSNYNLTFKRQDTSNDFYASYQDKSGTGTYNNFRATLDEANLSLRVVGSKGTSENTIDNNNLVFDQTFDVTNNGTSYSFYDGTSLKGHMKLEENDFNTNTYKAKVKEYNYHFLTFRLDYFYGLKNEFLKNTDYTSFDTYFRNTKAEIKDYRGTVKSGDTIYNQIMNSENISDYSNVLAYIIANLLGDGHTLFTSRSPLCGVCGNINSALGSVNKSPRDKQLSQYYSRYGQKRFNQNSNSSKPRLKISGSTAIIQFDAFNGKYISASSHKTKMEELSATLDQSYSNTPTNMYHGYLVKNCDTFTAIYFTISKIIPKYSNVKNIVFDVTINGGGYVLALAQLAALMTSDPTVIFKDTLNGGIGEYHYEVDTNGDGVYNASEDTFAGKYNFYVLQSEFSFSCANAFPTICKNMGCAKIIGSAYSGGGTCPVSYGYDALGSRFQISARHNGMLKNSNGEYIHNDDGCPADKIVDSSKWYIPSQLNSWINSNF